MAAGEGCAGARAEAAGTLLTLDLCSATRCTIFSGLYLANLNEVSEILVLQRHDSERHERSLFVVTTYSNRNGAFVRINKNKHVRAIQVNFVVDAKRPNNIPDSGVDLRAVDLVVETAVEDDAVPADTRGVRRVRRRDRVA